MLGRRRFLTLSLAAFACAGADGGAPTPAPLPPGPAIKGLPARPATVEPLVRSDEEWKAALQPLAYSVLRHEDTERPFTSAFWNHHERGTYVCAGCGLALFASDTKFDSGTGWPSYWQPIAAAYVKENRDASHGMVRTEVECARCGGHLGHVFDDGPKPTGLRYCINGVSLAFEPAT